MAQALFDVREFNVSLVTTIISLASPLRRPVLSFDHTLQRFYDNVNMVIIDKKINGRSLGKKLIFMQS